MLEIHLFVFRLISFSSSALFCIARGCCLQMTLFRLPYRFPCGLVWPMEAEVRHRGSGGRRAFLLLVLQAVSPAVAASFFVTPTADRQPLLWWSQFVLGSPGSWAGVFVIHCCIINYLETSQLKTTNISLSYPVPEV